MLAQVNLTRCNLKRAMWHQERALFLNPNDDRCVCAMGELLVFNGKPEEAEQWVRKSMRLNPYHPQRYWTHLARTLFHQHSYESALSAWDKVDNPRVDDLAYMVAANTQQNNVSESRNAVARLLSQAPNFDLQSFAERFPFANERDRNRLALPLRQALS